MGIARPTKESDFQVRYTNATPTRVHKVQKRVRWSVNASENAEDALGPVINGPEGDGDAKEVLVTVTTPFAAVDAVYASVPCSSVVTTK